MKISELVKEIRKCPYRTEKHIKIRKWIENKYEEIRPEYGIEKVICIDGLNTKKDKRILNLIRERKKFPVEELRGLEIEGSRELCIVKRSRAEFNMDWLQMIVNVMIVDKNRERVLMMEMNRGSRKMVGGHVGYKKGDYPNNLLEVFRENIIKEVEEELGSSEYIKTHIVDKIGREPVDLLIPGEEKLDYFDLFHIIALYIVEVEDIDKLYDVVSMNYNESEYEVPSIVSREQLTVKKNKWMLKYMNES